MGALSKLQQTAIGLIAAADGEPELATITGKGGAGQPQAAERH